MELYNKEKHHDLVMEHIKQTALSGLELEIYARCDNYGNGLTELVINGTDSILMKSKEFQEIFDEVFVGAEYYRIMTDYITQSQNDFFTGVRCLQGTSIDPMTSSRMIRDLENYFKTDCHPKNIPNDGNPFYEEDPETSRQEAIKRSFEPTFGMSAVKQIMKIDYTK